MQAAAIYRALLRCYPAPFREEYGAQMLLMFADQLTAARETNNPIKQIELWIDAAWDALTIAPKEHWHVIAQDVRYALRTLAARPGFAVVAILSLALGIGANGAIFSLWNHLLNSQLPGVQNPSEIVMLTNPGDAGLWHGDQEGERDWLTTAEFEQLRDHATSFSAMMASQSSLQRWEIHVENGGWEDAYGRLVSRNYFDFLGVTPILGRVFGSNDEPGDAPFVVISHSYWQRRFASRRDVLGKKLTVRNAVLRIIGVTPAGFIGESAGQQPDFWIPLGMQLQVLPGEDLLHDTPPSKAMWLHAFGRLRARVTPSQAEAEANAIFKGGLESFYGSVASAERRHELLDQRLKVRAGGRGASGVRADYSTSLTALLGAVGLLLLIASANLANLLIARGTARRHEIALRTSLGATRGRLMRQLVTESLVLAALGGCCGLATAWFLHGTLARMIAESDRTFRLAFRLDFPILAFTLFITVAAAIVFGVLPAWQVTRRAVNEGLREKSRSASGSRTGMRAGRLLVGLQFAMSLPLLVGAGLLSRTVYNLQHVDLGFPTEHLAMAEIDSRIAGYNSARSMILFEELREKITTIAGVKAATVSHNGIFTGNSSGDPIEVEGYTSQGRDDKGSKWDMVGPNYFSTLGIPLLLGREIVESDRTGSAKVCVINQAFARKFFAGRNPIGMHLTAIDEAPAATKRTTYEIVGVARDSRTSGLTNQIRPRFYMPFTQPHGDNVKRANFLIRTRGPAGPVLTSVRQLLHGTDASLPILYARSIEEQLAPETAQNRTVAQLALVFGGVALVLAAIGLYGVLSYNIARRRSEIAIRIALGARPGWVIGMILRETAALLGAGLLIGGVLSYVALRFIASELYGVAPQDPVTLIAVLAILLAVAFTAVYLPARRASQLDPMRALAHE